MKLLFTLLLIVGLSFANYTIFGPAGAPPGVITPTWIGDGLTASAELDMKGDTLAIISTTAGDADIYMNFQEADGSKHIIYFDDGVGRWVFGERVYFGNTIDVAAGSGQVANVTGSTRLISLSNNLILATASDPIINDPNTSGAGITQLGETGDNDITHINGRLQTNIITVATAYTMGADDAYMFTMTGNDSLRCPSTPIAGEVLMCKFTHASGGWIKGMGNTIDGSANVATSEDNNIMIIWNSTTSEWEIR